MGLALEVGVLAGLKENDPEGFDVFRSYFANVNTLLAQQGLPAHTEPTDVPEFKREFDDLIVHSDAEGFYLPLDFPDVLFGSDDQEVPGGMVGSAPRLLAECDRLARILGIPSEISKDSDELWDAADSQGEGESTWQQYGVESFTCVALREACVVSIKTGAAIVFT